MIKLNEKDIRALKLGAISAAAIVLFLIGSKWYEHWDKARTEVKVLKAKLKDIDISETKRKGLMAVVPTFKMPVEEREQQFLFRDEFNNELKKAGIKNDPLQIIPNRRSPLSGYKSLHLSCTAKCKFSQALDLLAKLNENPYLVGVEEFRMKLDPKKRSEVELNITVSTFTKIR
ncbi:MAG: hypothetical protein JSU69_11915 [Candidatus Zixiibacteriota bacterium]|nr:MAG: hypothetical protein JSU69_11915 [candidate division Zixibacteria bacterium]